MNFQTRFSTPWRCPASPGSALRQLLPLAFFLVLFSTPFSAPKVQAYCDVDITPEQLAELYPDLQPGDPVPMVCRQVPEYFFDNRSAIMRMIEEIGRRKDRDYGGEAVFHPYEGLTLQRFGYRCPDAQGRCPTTWIPSPDGEDGLSGGTSYAGSDHNLANTYVQRISGPGIGVQSIVDQRPIDAIDVWGDGAQDGGEVCFVGEGRLIYLDARTSPRAESTLSSTFEDGRTCGRMPGPGSVVFLPPTAG